MEHLVRSRHLTNTIKLFILNVKHIDSPHGITAKNCRLFSGNRLTCSIERLALEQLWSRCQIQELTPARHMGPAR